ncbi:MAG: serine hydrolase [Lewinellaceae bacterium]|nr:serine hydrolase [Lewinellaceae bacterium]
MKKIALSLLFALLALSHLAAQKNNKSKTASTGDRRLAGLDTMIQRVLHDWQAAGCGVAVVEKDQVLLASGFGFRDYEAQLPVTANTVFQIGSSSKAFTSALLGILADDKQLDFDEPVTTYLPDLRLHNDELNSHLTVRDLMCHRSGLPRHDMAWYLNPTTRDSFVYRMRFLEPSTGLRESWQYNNYGFLLQGVIAEKLTEKSWEDNIRERFFQPLDMKTALFDIWNAPPTADVAKGYYEKDGAIRFMDYYRIEGMGPAGSICASALEMANWVSVWINGGKFKGKDVLPGSYVQQAMTAQMAMGGGTPNPENPNIFFNNYGMGWMLSSYYGHYRVEHGGNINGFSASVCFFPSDSIGVVVLVNQNGSQVTSVVRNLIADRLLGLPYRDWSGELRARIQKQEAAAGDQEKVEDLSRKEGTTPSRSIEQFAGYYEHPGYGGLLVSASNDSLFARSSYVRFYLQHYHYDIFRPISLLDGMDVEEDSPVRVQFVSDLKGDPAELRAFGLEPSVESIVFKRKAVAVDMATGDLEKYCGAYSISGVEIKVFLKKDALTVLVPGQPEYETMPVGNHEFKLKSLDGYSVRFEVDAAGKAVAVNFIQPNGTFRAGRKE